MGFLSKLLAKLIAALINRQFKPGNRFHSAFFCEHLLSFFSAYQPIVFQTSLILVILAEWIGDLYTSQNHIHIAGFEVFCGHVIPMPE